MVKSQLVIAAVVYSTLACGQGITNINQCINTELTADVLASFPTNSVLTAQNCVLSFIKGSVEGDLRTFASPFSVEIRSSEFGFSDLNSIPTAEENEFLAVMTSISNSATRIVSYSEITSNGLVKSSIAFHRQGVGYNRDEVVHLEIAQTNGVWQIVNWEADE